MDTERALTLVVGQGFTTEMGYSWKPCVDEAQNRALPGHLLVVRLQPEPGRSFGRPNVAPQGEGPLGDFCDPDARVENARGGQIFADDQLHAARERRKDLLHRPVWEQNDNKSTRETRGKAEGARTWL